MMQANTQPSFLNCYICFETLKKPRMCPSCSKVACEKCLRQWIQERRSQCPHCRKTMPLANFAECQRFISDVRQLLKAMDRNEKVKQKCSEHKIQMTYYCQVCQEPICSDCSIFGVKHKGHPITHLKKIYQSYKNKILNQLARFDQKIQNFRKNGYQIKLEMQRLVIQIGQKKNFIEEYFLAIIERLEEEFKEKQEKVTEKYQSNAKQIQFLQSFRENICRELQSSSQKQLITKSDQLIGYIQSVYDKGFDYEQEEHNFDTIHEIVPKYNEFKYALKNYEHLGEGIIYSDPYLSNGIEWRMKIYPKGNGVAKQTHLSVFLEMSKAFTNGNKYEYKVQLVNQRNIKDSVIREYSSNFDIGECWGYNQFIPLEELKNDFLTENGHLDFNVSVRNPSYRSLVRDQQQYIQILQQNAKSHPPRKSHSSNNIYGNSQHLRAVSNPKMNELAEESKLARDKIKKFLMHNNDVGEEQNHQIQEMDLQELELPQLKHIRSADHPSDRMQESYVDRMNLSILSGLERGDDDDFQNMLIDRSYLSKNNHNEGHENDLDHDHQ